MSLTLTEALDAFGVKWQAVPGWETHGRPFDTAWEGLMGHHTAWSLSRSTEQQQINLVRNGRKGVPGPLYNALQGHDTLYLISAGYCNNAGRGMSKVLNRTKLDLPPKGDARTIYGSIGGRGDITGNKYYMAISLMHSGTGALRAPMRENYVRASAAMLYWQGFSANRYVAHKEWTSRKVDTTENLRPLIAERLDQFGASQAPPPGLVGAGSTHRLGAPVATVPSPRGGAYLLGADGGVFTARGPAGNVPPYFGSVPGLAPEVQLPVGVTAVDIAVGPQGDGYWILLSDGGIFTFGEIGYYGNAHNQLRGRKVTGVHPHKNGYVIYTDDPEYTFALT